MTSSGEEQISSKALKRVSSLSSSTSTSASSAASSHHQLPFSAYCQNSRAKTMEEVWKDINLSSLQDQPSSRDDRNTASFRTMMFQDFLARPFDKDPHQGTAGTAGRFGGGLTPPPPATLLTLNSVPEFHLLGNSSPLRQSLQPRSISHACSLNMQFDGLGPFPGMNAHGNGKKRGPEPENNSINNGDRRHKRMIKNRESAARSRARKQAYTSELELEVDQLKKENARLREQQRQLCQAASTNDQQPRRNHTLQRTFTAPF